MVSIILGVLRFPPVSDLGSKAKDCIIVIVDNSESDDENSR